MQQTLNFSDATHDPNEAPPGYYAVPKSSLPQDQGNLCRQCDFRPHCDAVKHRCMSYPATTTGGKIIQRKDGCSVVFKRNPH